jgi:hypothetical protein
MIPILDERGRAAIQYRSDSCLFLLGQSLDHCRATASKHWASAIERAFNESDTLFCIISESHLYMIQAYGPILRTM